MNIFIRVPNDIVLTTKDSEIVNRTWVCEMINDRLNKLYDEEISEIAECTACIGRYDAKDFVFGIERPGMVRDKAIGWDAGIQDNLNRAIAAAAAERLAGDEKELNTQITINLYEAVGDALGRFDPYGENIVANLESSRMSPTMGRNMTADAKDTPQIFAYIEKREDTNG